MEHYLSPSPTTVPSISLKEQRSLPQPQHPLATVHQEPPVSQHQPTLSNKELRDTIVQILSTTANGCLTELGYFPGMTQRLHELEATNQNWQSENVKLFEDNRNLLVTISDMREREKLMPVQDLEKINKIRNLELQLAAVKQDSIPKVKFDELHMHFSTLRTSYTAAYEEVQRLTTHIRNMNSLAANAGLMLPPPPPRRSSVDTNQQAQAHSVAGQLAPHPSQPPAPIQHPAPPGVWHGGQPIRVAGSASGQPTPGGPAQQRRHSSQPLPPQPGQNGHPLQQTRYAQQNQQPHQVTGVDQHVRRASAGQVNAQSGYPSPHAQFQQPQSQIAPGQMVSTPTDMQPPQQLPQAPQQPPPPYTQFRSPANWQPGPQPMTAGNFQPASYPPNPYPSVAPPPQPTLYRLRPIQGPPSHHTPSPAPRGSSSPLSLDTNVRPMKTEMPPTPLSASNMQPSSSFSTLPPVSSQSPASQSSDGMPPPVIIPNHAQPPHIGHPQMHQMPAQQYTMQMQQSNSPAMATMSPTDMYINPPSSTEQQSLVDPSPFATTFDNQQSATTAPPSTAMAEQAPSPARLKRSSVTMLEDDGVDNDPQKRPRLEDSQQHAPDSMYGNGHVAHSYASGQTQQIKVASQVNSYDQVYAPVPSEPISAPILDQSALMSDSMYPIESGMMNDDGHQIEEDDMEYEVEVGPDGLRLVRDCLEEFFERFDGGDRICKLCLLRQQRNQISQPPLPFINAADEDLEMHCLTEHEKAWTLARQVD